MVQRVQHQLAEAAGEHVGVAVDLLVRQIGEVLGDGEASLDDLSRKVGQKGANELTKVKNLQLRGVNVLGRLLQLLEFNKRLVDLCELRVPVAGCARGIIDDGPNLISDPARVVGRHLRGDLFHLLADNEHHLRHAAAVSNERGEDAEGELYLGEAVAAEEGERLGLEGGNVVVCDLTRALGGVVDGAVEVCLIAISIEQEVDRAPDDLRLLEASHRLHRLTPKHHRIILADAKKEERGAILDGSEGVAVGDLLAVVARSYFLGQDELTIVVKLLDFKVRAGGVDALGALVVQLNLLFDLLVGFLEVVLIVALLRDELFEVIGDTDAHFKVLSADSCRSDLVRDCNNVRDCAVVEEKFELADDIVFSEADDVDLFALFAPNDLHLALHDDVHVLALLAEPNEMLTGREVFCRQRLCERCLVIVR